MTVKKMTRKEKVKQLKKNDQKKKMIASRNKKSSVALHPVTRPKIKFGELTHDVPAIAEESKKVKESEVFAK